MADVNVHALTSPAVATRPSCAGDDVALPSGPRFAAFDAAAAQRVRALFEALEFRSLLPRVAVAPEA